MAANGSAFTYADPLAPQGSQVAFLQGNGTVCQSVALAAGTYMLTFDAAQRAGYGSESFRVVVDGAVVATFTPGGTYAAESATFAVAAGNHTVTLQGVAPDSGDHAIFVDNVLLSGAAGVVALQNAGFEQPAAGSGWGAYTYQPEQKRGHY